MLSDTNKRTKVFNIREKRLKPLCFEWYVWQKLVLTWILRRGEGVVMRSTPIRSCQVLAEHHI